MIFMPLVMAPTALAFMPRSSVWPVMHDGVISGLRAYSRSAFIELGETADPDMQTEFLPPPRTTRLIPPPLGVVYSRSARRYSLAAQDIFAEHES
jgi:hypothetical protein